MKKIILIALLFIYSESHAQWTTVTPPSGTLNVYSVFAIGDSALAIACDNKVSRSLDAGATWTTPLTVNPSTFYEVHSPEPTHWYALTSNTTWFLKLGNPSGLNASNGKPDSILSLHFYTGGCGIAVGYAGKIEATCDTGASWQLRSSGTLFNLNAIWFADAATGCACGTFGAITCTQNSGATWATVSSTVSQTLNAIHFPTSSVGYIAGNTGIILKSTDSGVTWNSISSGVPNNLNGIFFIDADTGYVAGSSGLIMKTIDGGQTWNTMTTMTTQTLNSIHFSSPTVGWAVGNQATILKFSDFPTGISEDNFGAGIFVYPNPVRGQLAVGSRQLAIREIEVIDVFGKKVRSNQLSTNNYQLTFDASELLSGIYFVRVQTEKGISTVKFIKE